jgi:hypothetical protein
MGVYVSDELDGEFFVRIEDMRYSGPQRIVAQQVFKVGDSTAEWVAKHSRQYLNKRVAELTKPKPQIPLHPEPGFNAYDAWNPDGYYGFDEPRW